MTGVPAEFARQQEIGATPRRRSAAPCAQRGTRRGWCGPDIGSSCGGSVPPVPEPWGSAPGDDGGPAQASRWHATAPPCSWPCALDSGSARSSRSAWLGSWSCSAPPSSTSPSSGSCYSRRAVAGGLRQWTSREKGRRRRRRRRPPRRRQQLRRRRPPRHAWHPGSHAMRMERAAPPRSGGEEPPRRRPRLGTIEEESSSQWRRPSEDAGAWRPEPEPAPSAPVSALPSPANASLATRSRGTPRQAPRGLTPGGLSAEEVRRISSKWGADKHFWISSVCLAASDDIATHERRSRTWASRKTVEFIDKSRKSRGARTRPVAGRRRSTARQATTATRRRQPLRKLSSPFALLRVEVLR